MGYHIFSFPPSADASNPEGLDCNDVAPWQVLYHNNTLNGFVFQGSIKWLRDFYRVKISGTTLHP